MFITALVNKLVPWFAWPLSGAREIPRLQLRLLKACSEKFSFCAFVDAPEEEKEEKEKSREGLGPPEGSTVPESGGSLTDTRISTSGPDQSLSSITDSSLEKRTTEADRDSEEKERRSGESPGNSKGDNGVKEPKGNKGNSEGESVTTTAERRQGRAERAPRETVPRTAEERVQLAKKMMALRQKERLEELESSDRKAMDFLQRLEKEKAQRLSDKKKRDKERKRDIEDRIRKLTSEEYVK